MVTTSRKLSAVRVLLALSMSLASSHRTVNARNNRTLPPDTEKIVGGRRVEVQEFPFIAAMMRIDDEQVCGSSIISKHYILTACHCVVESSDKDVGQPKLLDASDYYFVGGVVDLEDRSTGKYQRRDAKLFLIHPQCYNRVGFYYDYAMAKMKKKWSFNRYVQPVKFFFDEPDKLKTLIMKTSKLRKTAQVAGWGDTSPDHTEDNSSVMKVVTIQFIPYDECRDLLCNLHSKFCTFRFEDFGQACGLGFTRSETDCTGDSGGPVFIDDKIVALVSFGYKCGQYDEPGVYAGAGLAKEWVDSVTRRK